MSEGLIDLVLQVREQSGRPLDADGLQRITGKIAFSTPSELTQEQATLRRLLDHAAKNPKGNADRP